MTTTALTAAHLSPGSNLTTYIQTVNAIEPLTAEREKELAIRLSEHDDIDAARELVTSHLRFVVHLARSFQGYGLPLGDLIQEGNLGLMKAVKRFDPYVGVRLVTFAVHWIKSEMYDYVIRNWRIVKIATTKAQRKLFFNLRQQKKGIGWLNSSERKAIAKDLGVKPSEVSQMERRLAAQDMIVESSDVYDEDDPNQANVVTLVDTGSNPEDLVIEKEWKRHVSKELHQALDQLDDRSRDILMSRWLNEDGTKVTLHELAERYDISAERVRQLEKNAIKTLGNQLKPLLEAA